MVPVRDAEAFVADALRSVADQTLPVDECVVVDDGSTDRTDAVVSEWAARHETFPLRRVRQGRRGAAAARSAGVRAAESDLIALLDADDLLLPDGLATLEAGFEAWPDLAVCFADAGRRLVGGGVGESYLAGKPVWGLPFTAVRTEISTGPVEVRRIEEGVFESLLGGSYIANCAALVSREAALTAGLWSSEFPTAEDRDFWLRLSRVGPFAYSSKLVAQVRYHGSNLTAARGDAAHACDAARVLQKTARQGDRLGLSDHEKGAVEAALGRAVEQALYAASVAGLRAYRQTVSTLHDGATRVGWATPRHLARLLLAPLIRARNRRPTPRPQP